MSNVILFALSLVPLVAAVAWEQSLRARRRSAVLPPEVSPELLRWVQYGVWSYLLGLLAVVLMWGDAHGHSLALLGGFACTSLAAGALWWDLASRHAGETPRLSDLRAQCYNYEAALWRRAKQLAVRAQGASGNAAWSACHLIGRSEELTARCEQQLRRLHEALTTEAFAQRVSDPAAARVDLAALQATQVELLRDIHLFLDRSAVEVVVGKPAYDQVRA